MKSARISPHIPSDLKNCRVWESPVVRFGFLRLLIIRPGSPGEENVCGVVIGDDVDGLEEVAKEEVAAEGIADAATGVESS